MKKFDNWLRERDPEYFNEFFAGLRFLRDIKSNRGGDVKSAGGVQDDVTDVTSRIGAGAGLAIGGPAGMAVGAGAGYLYDKMRRRRLGR